MRASITLLLCCLLWAPACSPQTTGTAVLFEGARLITGDGSAPVENSAFLIENDRFTRIGRKGEVDAPAGAMRVDLTGKTVMPAMVDVHSHLGFWKDAGLSKQNFTRENLIDHLNRYAYHGVAAVMSVGTDLGDLPFQVRQESHPGAALFRTVGRGLAWPKSGPADPSRNDVPYPITTEAEARKAVQELAALKVDFVKIWVDDRNETVPKLTPPLYRAGADEARKHNLRVIAHVFDLADAKGLVQAGAEGFTHLVRDEDIDDELIGLLKQRPNAFFTPNIGGTARAIQHGRPSWLDEPLLSETISPALLKRFSDSFANRKPEDAERSRGAWERVIRNMSKLRSAGVRLVLGSDATGEPGRFFGWNAHMELDSFVAAGMTPAEAIVAATSLAADVLRLNQLGAVAAGKSADFIVLDANPLDNIANTRRIARVYLRGKEVDRAGLRAKWSAEWKSGSSD
jgi:imidazolonepropionase-like amidohydrolase